MRRTILFLLVIGTAVSSFPFLSRVTAPPVAAQKKVVVMREWSRALRQMGIVPIYPPREDVYVGDLYVYAYNPDGPLAEKALDKGDLRLGMSPRFGSLLPDKDQTILVKLSDDYLKRPIWPATPRDYANMLTGQLASTIWGQPTATEGSVFVQDSSKNRLKIVGFPEFLSASFNQGDLTALIPTEAFKVGFGFSWNKAKSVTVKIPAAESYSLSLMDVYPLLFGDKPCRTDTHEDADVRAIRVYLKSEYCKALGVFSNEGFESLRSKQKNPQTDPDTDAVWIRVITEVYYARVMDIGVTTNKTKGVLGEADVSATLPLNPGAKNDNSNGNTNGNSNSNSNANSNANENANANSNASPAPTPLNINMAATPVDRATQMNQRLTGLGAQRVPGGAFGFITASDSSISMRRVWQYPIAVGFRGMLVKVNRGTGRVLGVASTSGVPPTVAAK